MTALSHFDLRQGSTVSNHSFAVTFRSTVTLAFLLITSALLARQTTAAEPLPQAHAHNDYRHENPLADALSYGFCSIEADVFLIDGELLVAHDLHEVKAERTLQALYLDPLRERVEKNGGRVFAEGPLVTLLVDFKSEGESTYKVLETILKDYHGMLCHIESGRYVEGAVQVVVSGNRPIETMQAATSRYGFVDGRKDNLDKKTYPEALMPLISDRWTSLFKWRGKGPISDAEQAKLEQMVQQAHANGQRVRFWATPENEDVWKVLADAGVDHINTDQLERLARFLRTR